MYRHFPCNLQQLHSIIYIINTMNKVGHCLAYKEGLQSQALMDSSPFFSPSQLCHTWQVLDLFTLQFFHLLYGTNSDVQFSEMLPELKEKACEELSTVSGASKHCDQQLPSSVQAPYFSKYYCFTDIRYSSRLEVVKYFQDSCLLTW